MSALEELLLIQMKAAKLPPPEREIVFAADIKRRWRFDFAWTLRMLAVEVDGGQWVGGRHGRPQGAEKDNEKMNEANIRGWMCLRFTTSQVNDGRALATIERAFGREAA